MIPCHLRLLRSPLWFAAVVVLAVFQPVPIKAQGADAGDRRMLYNDCRPVEVLVEALGDDAKAIGLTEGRLRKTAELLLRSARLYTDSRNGSGHRLLYVRVLCAGELCVLTVEFAMYVYDPERGVGDIRPTWEYRFRTDPAFSDAVLIMRHFVDGVKGSWRSTGE